MDFAVSITLNCRDIRQINQVQITAWSTHEMWLLLPCKMKPVKSFINSDIWRLQAQNDMSIGSTCCTSSSGFSSLLLAAGSSVTLSWVVTAAGFLRRIDPRELSVMLWIWNMKDSWDKAPPTSSDVTHNQPSLNILTTASYTAK